MSKSKSRGPKMRTQKTAAKRAKRTGTGLLRIRHACKSHLLARKSAERKRRLRKPGIVDAADRRQFNRLVPPAYS